jgi:hypothetical protein
MILAADDGILLESGMRSGAPLHLTPKTGTSQDLFTVVTAAYERHLAANPADLPRKTSAQRLALELPFVLLGKAIAAAMRALPAETALAAHGKLFGGLAAPKSYPFEAGAETLVRALDLAARLERETGKAPALIALVSHPPVLGEMAHMNFELARHALLALRAVRGRACRPRAVVAIDPFALDTLPVWQEGAYAGFMGTYHLGIDRMAVGRQPVTRACLPRTAWDRMAHRLLRLLADGGEASMVLAGGVPSTTRTLYAAREWVAEARRKSLLRERPREALRGLRQVPMFEAFESTGPHGERLRGSAWRLAEAYVMSTLAGVFVDCAEGGLSCAELGRLHGPGRKAMNEFLSAFGVEAPAIPKLLAQLDEELARETPFRRRFFKILAARVARSRPVVIIPVTHRVGARMGVEVREACGWSGYAHGKIEAMMGGDGAARWTSSPEHFAVQFGRENFA